MMRLVAMLLVGVVGSFPVAAGAQSTSSPKVSPPRQEIPKDQRPPKGMCRVWMNRVPVARQPAPTDCATAVRNRPPNARIIFPDDSGGPKPVTRPLVLPPGKSAPRAVKDTGAVRRRKPPTDRPPA